MLWSFVTDERQRGNGKLGNGRYNRIIKQGFFLEQIEDALQKIRNHKGVVKNIKITGDRPNDFKKF